MPREVSEWKGKTDDTAIPPRVRQRVHDKTNGLCAKCSRKLRAGHWECDHIIPLILGGKHAEGNLQALCAVPCHKAKTALDAKLKSKVARVRARSLGIKKKRTITRWRKFDGTIVTATRER